MFSIASGHLKKKMDGNLYTEEIWETGIKAIEEHRECLVMGLSAVQVNNCQNNCNDESLACEGGKSRLSYWKLFLDQKQRLEFSFGEAGWNGMACDMWWLCWLLVYEILLKAPGKLMWFGGSCFVSRIFTEFWIRTSGKNILLIHCIFTVGILIKLCTEKHADEREGVYSKTEWACN